MSKTTTLRINNKNLSDMGMTDTMIGIYSIINGSRMDGSYKNSSLIIDA
jgi:hypothetical protein